MLTLKIEGGGGWGDRRDLDLQPHNIPKTLLQKPPFCCLLRGCVCSDMGFNMKYVSTDRSRQQDNAAVCPQILNKNDRIVRPVWLCEWNNRHSNNLWPTSVLQWLQYADETMFLLSAEDWRIKALQKWSQIMIVPSVVTECRTPLHLSACKLSSIIPKCLRYRTGLSWWHKNDISF